MSFLPTRDGDEVGKAQEFAMGELAGDCDEIRTVEWQNGDGSVTRLRTRGGMPIFETEKVYGTGASEQSARGFVAMVPGGRAVLFDPYTLAILDSDYSPAGKLYTVEEFATTWNVPTSDTTHWYDVVLFDGTVIKINAKAMPDLQIVADQLYPAIPYVISRHDASDQYGNAERNATEKRVFAVGRYAVTSWGGGGVTKTLTPMTPRTDNKALILGQVTDTAGNTATLGQFYFTGASWDDLAGGWGYSSIFVQMALFSPFLSSVPSSSLVDMPIPVFSGPVSSSGTMSTDTTLPATEIALVGHGEVAATIPYASNVVPPGGGGNGGYYSCRFNFDGTESRPLSGVVDASYTRLEYLCQATDSESECGKSLDFSGTNRKVFDTRSETTRIPAQTIVLYSEPVDLWSNTLSALMTGDANNLYWGGYYVSPPGGPFNDGTGPGPNRGTPNKYIGNISIPGASATRQYEEQSGSFSVRLDGYDIVKVDFVHNKSTGQKAVLTPRQSTTYASILAQPPSNYYNVGSGLGVYNGPVRLLPYVDPATDMMWINAYHGVWHGGIYNEYTQATEAVDTINEKYSTMRARFVAQKLYDSENTNGDTTRSGDPYYTASVDPSITLETHTLNWTTRDFILHDDANEVYITVDGTFSATKNYGASATATMTVVLNINTPWGSDSKTLYELTYTYSNMLPESDEIAPGKYAIPSPQIRALFTPKYREQGSFRGATYVTKAEVANGATPACLINFVLLLEPYSFIGTDETDDIVHFIPCNLLEMLYAFVFSRKYGVDPAERYPVDDSWAFNTIMAGLFGVQRNIQFRDGQLVEWVVNLGISHIDSLKTGIYRV